MTERKKNKLVCMLRVKDGILFVDQWLEKMEQLVDEIVVVDNGSTDGTLEKLEASSRVVDIRHTQEFDEGRDKIMAYNMARARKPDWIIWLDIDEIFEDRLTRRELDKMMESPTITRYWFRRFHLHRDERHFEASTKKIFQIAWPDRVMWKDQPSGYFRYAKIHCDLIRGIKGKSRVTSHRIKHYGQLNREYLERKTQLYISIDPDQKDKYARHRDQVLNTWPWYEYNENPVVTRIQIAILNMLFGLRVINQKLFKMI